MTKVFVLLLLLIAVANMAVPAHAQGTAFACQNRLSNGQFTVTIDFGTGVFTGNNFWLDISVSPAGSNVFADLSPRQPILPTPYAMMVNTARNLLGRLPGSELLASINTSQFNKG
ncbi:MAG TPA: hypothetical protein VGJ73_02260 [Verrucomicrobiae bacterium]